MPAVITNTNRVIYLSSSVSEVDFQTCLDTQNGDEFILSYFKEVGVNLILVFIKTEVVIT